MSLGHGASIVRDGLIFYYDIANKKSFKGKPTTNLFDYRNDFSGWSRAGSSIIPADAISPDGTLNATRLTSTTVNTGIYRVNCPFTNSTTYTTSIYVRAGSTTQFYGGFSNQFEGASWYYYWDLSTKVITNGSQSGFTSGSGSIVTLPNGWLRLVVTATTEASGNTTSIGAYWRVNAATSYVWIYGAQTEQHEYATPFADNTRSTTESLVDLVGGNTITANSLTYAADNTFSFNGSSDYASITSGTNFTFGTDDFTLEAWYYPNVSYGVVINGYIFDSGANGTRLQLYNNYVHFTLQSQAAVVNGPAGVGIQAGAWYHLVGTRVGSTLTLYLNGASIGTSTGGTSLSDAGGTIGNYGGGGDYKFNGKIPVIRVYKNKGLTQSEVLQNFNAQRGRYGI